MVLPHFFAAESRRTRITRLRGIAERHVYRLACLLLFVFCVTVAARQTPPQPPVDPVRADSVHETDHLTIRLSSSDQRAPTGARVSLFVDIVPKPKMHVYAPEQKEYIPVRLTVDASAAYKLDVPTYPPAEKFFFKPLNETQLVYSKPFRIVQPLALTARDGVRTSPATLTITGTLRYQACDDVICYVPKNVPLAWTVNLKAASR